MGMRLWLALATLAVSGAGAAACQSSAFACQSDDACPDGRCEPQGWCSFPDATCPSGYRFGEHAAEGLSETCVEVAETGSSTGEVSSTSQAATTESTSTTASASEDTTGASSSSETSSTQSSSSDTSSDTSSGSTTGPGRPVLVTVPIVSNADDGAIYATPQKTLIWAQSGEDGEGNGFFGEYPGGEHYVGYFRFALPDEVDTATLIDARLRLEATTQLTYMWNADAQAVGIWLESSENAPTVEGTDAFPWLLGGPPSVGVTLLDTNVRWPDSGGLTWEAGANTSPNVAPLIALLRQEFDALSGGNHIQFWLAVATPTGVGGEVTYVDFASGDSAVPQLELTFEPSM